MTARLRSMVVDHDRTILVLDQIRDEPMWSGKLPEVAEVLQEMAERVGLAGAVCFLGSIELPDEKPEAVR